MQDRALCILHSDSYFLEMSGISSKASEVKPSLSCLSHHRVSMQHPGQVLDDVDNRALKAVYPVDLLILRGT